MAIFDRTKLDNYFSVLWVFLSLLEFIHVAGNSRRPFIMGVRKLRFASTCTKTCSRSI